MGYDSTVAVETGTTSSAGLSSILMFLPSVLVVAAIVAVIYFLNKRSVAKAKLQIKSVGVKSKWAAAVLAFIFGIVGIHRYYLGYKKQGIAQTCGGICLFIGLPSIKALLEAEANVSVATIILLDIMTLYGIVVAFWVLIDFIQILMDRLLPIDGQAYKENRIVSSAPTASDNADALGKLAKLHEQGILTDEEFAAKKKDILAKM